jgi:hypothetical protein
LDDGKVAWVVVEEVVRRVGLNPEQQRGVLAKALLKK